MAHGLYGEGRNRYGETDLGGGGPRVGVELVMMKMLKMPRGKMLVFKDVEDVQDLGGGGSRSELKGPEVLGLGDLKFGYVKMENH